MLEEKFRQLCEKYSFFNKKERIIIGVSGGPDSTALLYLLNSLKKEFKLSLHIAHLDHMLRKDSLLDAEYVSSLAKRLNLPVSIKKIDVRTLAKRGISIEEAARNARLNFLFGLAKKNKTKKIALGHNLDDQAETVLMRIIRGAGLYGLSGILPKRKILGFEIIRPLIGITRKEIEAYLKFKKIKPRIDASNFQDIYLRNRIRNKLIPLLEKEYNPAIKEILGNTAQSLAYDYDYLIGRAKSMPENKKKRIPLARLNKLHPAMRRLLLRLRYMRLKGDLRRLSYKHIREIEDLISSRPFNSIVDLPKGISVAKTKKFLVFQLKHNR